MIVRKSIAMGCCGSYTKRYDVVDQIDEDEKTTIVNHTISKLQINGQIIPGKARTKVNYTTNHHLDIKIIDGKVDHEVKEGYKKKLLFGKDYILVVERFFDDREIHIGNSWRKTGLINESSKILTIKSVETNMTVGYLLPKSSDIYDYVYLLTVQLNSVSFVVDSRKDNSGMIADTTIDGLDIKYLKFDGRNMCVYKITDAHML